MLGLFYTHVRVPVTGGPAPLLPSWGFPLLSAVATPRTFRGPLATVP